LKELRIKFPLTILYLSLHLLGYVVLVTIYLLEQQLGDFQYFPPGCMQIPSNRLFAQFDSPQSKTKEEIIKDVTSDNPSQRLLLFGMGIDPPNVERVIQFGVPRRMEHYLQETGRIGQKSNGAANQEQEIFLVSKISPSASSTRDLGTRLCKTTAPRAS